MGKIEQDKYFTQTSTAKYCVEKVKEIIAIEQNADRLKEELIEKFIKRESMAFSRDDRINLIEEIDITLDNIEYCARTIQTHTTIIED